MQLNHIAGNSYFLDGDNGVGVYVFSDRTCLLVDSGSSASQAKKIMTVLSEEGLQIETIFNTHAHVDHCGGNQYLQTQCQCRIIASPLAAAIIENPILGPAMLFTAYPLRVLRSRILMASPSKVDQIIGPGSLLIKNELFQIYDLPGHSLGQTGLATPDGVVFLGDSLMHPRMLQEYPFLYMVDITRQLETLAFIGSQKWPFVLLTHGGLVEDLGDCAEKNQARIAVIAQEILTLLDQRRSHEEILAAMLIQYDLSANSGQYYLVSSTIAAFISYLSEQKMIKNRVEQGVMKFYRGSFRDRKEESTGKG
ncbi:MAG: MBL fold metallo-hydrolase [Syntrophomonadaceae bacterium]|nr:MBL fold metallo-hydrolase [Syntrophomonadaceae bacterium]